MIESKPRVKNATVDSCFEMVGSRQHSLAARSRTFNQREVSCLQLVHLVTLSCRCGVKFSMQRDQPYSYFSYLMYMFIFCCLDLAYTSTIFVRGPLQFIIYFLSIACIVIMVINRIIIPPIQISYCFRLFFNWISFKIVSCAVCIII